MNTYIKKLQTLLGVKPDGDYGPLTDKALMDKLNSKTSTSIRPLDIALSFYGLKETPGPVANPTVLQFYKDVGHSWVKDDSVAWCAAFVGACLIRAKLPSTGLLSARSYLSYSKETKTPKIGDIAVFKRGSNPAEGHVGFFIRQDGNTIYILGGNQSDSVNISTQDVSSLLSYRSL